MLASLVRISALTGAFLLAAPAARGAAPTPPTKEECLEAHSKGQDAREAGQFVQAGALFLTCAQPACPALVQSDCARFADETSKLQPTVTFAARDSEQNDLLDTSVFVDGTLVSSQLGDGKAYDIDPGRHEVRFVHRGAEIVVNVVVNQGEKGRGVVGVFPAPPAASPSAAPGSKPTRAAPAPAHETAELKRPAAPLVMVGLGAAAAALGGVLLGVGLNKVPARCSLWTKECAAPPNDAVFGQAASGVRLVNVGSILAVGGAVTFAGSLLWYFTQPLGPAKPAPQGLLPWIGPKSAGLSFSKPL